MRGLTLGLSGTAEAICLLIRSNSGKHEVEIQDARLQFENFPNRTKIEISANGELVIARKNRDSLVFCFGKISRSS